MILNTQSSHSGLLWGPKHITTVSYDDRTSLSFLHSSYLDFAILFLFASALCGTTKYQRYQMQRLLILPNSNTCMYKTTKFVLKLWSKAKMEWFFLVCGTLNLVKISIVIHMRFKFVEEIVRTRVQFVINRYKGVNCTRRLCIFFYSYSSLNKTTNCMSRRATC